MEVKNNGRITIAEKTQLAIVGMETILGDMDGLAAFETGLVHGHQQKPPAPEYRFELNPDEKNLLGLIDNQMPHLENEAVMLLKTAAGALRDAGISEISTRSAFFYSTSNHFINLLSGDPNPPAILPFSGQAVDFSKQGNPLAAELIEAHRLLSAGEVDVVILSAACLAKNVLEPFNKENRKLNNGPITLGFDELVDGWSIGEGAAALVLMTVDGARSAGKRIYAILNAYAWVSRDTPTPKKSLLPTFVSADTIRECILAVYDQNGTRTENTGFLEVLASGFPALDSAEIMGLTQGYRCEENKLTCALGAVSTQGGYLFNAASLFSLIKTALIVYHHFLPGTPGWSNPKKPELWKDSPFYILPESKSWFLDDTIPERLAAVNSLGWDGSCLHLLLSEESGRANHPSPFLKKPDFFLFPVCGNSYSELETNLRTLRGSLKQQDSLLSLASSHYGTYCTRQEHAFTLSITGHDRSEIDSEIELALNALASVFETKKNWLTPMGSCFTPVPLGPQAKIAFVYPGAFNSYIGLGRELLLMFPDLYTRLNLLTDNISQTIQDAHLYPRSLAALNPEQLSQLEGGLNADPIAMITSGSLMAVLFSMIMQDVFKIKPAAALGYSLGEIAMMFGLGVWSEADATRVKLTNSPLFQTRLAGPQNAVRAAWNLPEVAKKPEGETLWSNYFVMAPAEKVMLALQDTPRVYLTHINTPRQVVIGGDEKSCQKVISSIKAMSLKAPFEFAIHNPVIRSERESIINLNTWPINNNPQACLYSAASFSPLQMDSREIAAKFADMMCNTIDFPRLVNRVYEDGARIFIELGPNANCSKWIDETLKGKEALAVAINRKGSSDLESLVRLLSRLATHHISMDLTPLYQA